MVRCAQLPHFPHRCLKSHFMAGRVGGIITRPCAWWHRQHMDLMGCSNLSLALFDDAIISLFLPFEEGMCGYWFSMSVERNEIHPNVNSDSAGRDVLIVQCPSIFHVFNMLPNIIWLMPKVMRPIHTQLAMVWNNFRLAKKANFLLDILPRV